MRESIEKEIQRSARELRALRECRHDVHCHRNTCDLTCGRTQATECATAATYWRSRLVALARQLED